MMRLGCVSHVLDPAEPRSRIKVRAKFKNFARKTEALDRELSLRIIQVRMSAGGPKPEWRPFVLAHPQLT
jgi:hypothetical protein